MKTLKLFNAVVAKDSKAEPFVSEEGFIIEPAALWAKDRILEFYLAEKLNGNDLNKTFHKSWKKIKDSTRCELLIHQIMHYITTYGTNFTTEVYIPDEVLDVPDVKLSYKVIKAYTVEEMTEKCLSLLRSGIALDERTLDDVLTVLVDELKYTFTGKEGIRNKEAIIKIADLYGVLPDDTMEFFRYIIYRATGTSLLIKSRDMVKAVEETSFNPSAQFNKFGLEKLAAIFNRFKPLFIAFKGRCPATINKISKLSKTYHQPLVSNPLNQATNMLLTEQDTHWLNNATPFALFKALSACYSRMKGQDTFVYRIRSGKSWVKETAVSKVNKKNYKFLLKYLKSRFDLTGLKLYFPEDIRYALPTSEKMYVGNIPTGTKFFGKKLAVGMYWEDAWGARDLDLSGLNIGGKVGWNAAYKQGEGNLMYSGDITSARNGAVEYLYAKTGLKDPTLVMLNVFAGSDDSKYKIIVGKGDKISNDYMMNPNNLVLDVASQAVQKNTILGIFLPEEDQQSFVLLDFGAGHARVSGQRHIGLGEFHGNDVSTMATKALYQQWKKPLSFNKLVKQLGAAIVETEEEADISYSIDALEKDSFTKVFEYTPAPAE